MLSSISNSEVTIREIRWLRRYGWLFAVIGIPAGIIIDGLLWVAITLDAAYVPSSTADWFTLKGFVIGIGIAAIPLVWLLSLNMEKKFGGVMRKYPVAPALAFTGFLIFELLLRSFPAQEILWQSVRSRSGPDYFAREISLLRLDEAARRHAGDNARGTVVAGSSQMLHALDQNLLGELTGHPVYRRAVAGMFPIELCASSGFMDFNSENTLLLMISGFDLGGRNSLLTDSIRPLATPTGIGDLFKASTGGFLLKHWRAFIDLKFASICETWRSRDYVRYIINQPFRANQNVELVADDAVGTALQKEAYIRLGQNKEVLEFSRSSLNVFLNRMAVAFRHVVVFEGRVNPGFPGNDFPEMSRLTREILTEQAAKGHIRFIPLERQDIEPGREIWLDMAHVNESGKTLFTEMFARELNKIEAGN